MVAAPVQVAFRTLQASMQADLVADLADSCGLLLNAAGYGELEPGTYPLGGTARHAAMCTSVLAGVPGCADVGVALHVPDLVLRVESDDGWGFVAWLDTVVDGFVTDKATPDGEWTKRFHLFTCDFEAWRFLGQDFGLPSSVTWSSRFT